ncbi:MAG: SUF system Fe-S cluster assembly protein [Planctomycetota bacterium]
MSDETPVTPTPPESEGAPAAQPERPRILTDLVEKPLEEQVVDALRSVFDPEIPVNIYDLGLIYDVEVDAEDAHVHVRMTLTSPACPVAGSLPGEVQLRLQELEGIDTAEIELVWDPPWTRDMLSEEAKLQLGLA